jgi:hypothetical protein
MKITQRSLASAVGQNIINQEQATLLWAHLSQSGDTPTLNITHLLYYAGGVLALLSMTLFLSVGWDMFGGLGVMALATIYGAGSFALMKRQITHDRSIVAGLFATLSLVMMPLFMFGLQQYAGWFPQDNVAYQEYHQYIRPYWVFMELATLMTGAIMYYKYRLPFLILPITITTWYMSMDMGLLLFEDIYSRQSGNIITGFSMMLGAVVFELRRGGRSSSTYWWYTIGILTFWIGMTVSHASYGLGALLYCVINVLLMIFGVIVQRRIAVGCGALGSLGYLCYLAVDVFSDTLLFPIAATALGGLLIYIGVQWQKHGAKWTSWCWSKMPHTLQILGKKFSPPLF